MTTAMRAELFRVLEKLVGRYPHWRVGQLVANIAGMTDVDIWDVEDDQLLEAAVKHLESRFGHRETETASIDAKDFERLESALAEADRQAKD